MPFGLGYYSFSLFDRLQRKGDFSLNDRQLGHSSGRQLIANGQDKDTENYIVVRGYHGWIALSHQINDSVGVGYG